MPYLEPDEDAWRRHRETLDAHLPFRDFELVRPTPKSGKRYVSSSGLPVFDKAGRFTGYRGVARDITERKRAAEALREAQMQLAHANRVATMGQLTASIAHEVNQPIAATVTNAEAALRFLSARRPDLDEVREALGWIVRDGDRAGAVVSRIRNLIKKAPPSDERVEINAAIREVIEITRGEAMKNGVVVQTDLGDDLPLVPGDRVELQQVILNLILNAIEAMSATSEGSRELLITKGKNESDDVLVAVRDSGPGLAPAALEHLFKAFHTTKPNGLGLGLSICRSIVESHGGRLWASANAPRSRLPIHVAVQFVCPIASLSATNQKTTQLFMLSLRQHHGLSATVPDIGLAHGVRPRRARESNRGSAAVNSALRNDLGAVRIDGARDGRREASERDCLRHASPAIGR